MFGAIAYKILSNIHKIPKLYAWGSNTSRGFGDQTIIETGLFTQINGDMGSSWTYIDSNGDSTNAIKNGELWGWGSNSFNQIGNSGSSTSSPVRIGTDSDWSIVRKGGGTFSLGIKNGELYAWGSATHGVLGNNSNSGTTTSPVRIGTSGSWTKVACGSTHSLGINNGELYSWGNNYYGQLGLGDQLSRSSPVRIGTFSDWTDVAAGGGHSLAIRDSKLYAWGDNTLCQLGDETIGNLTWDPSYVADYWWWWYEEGPPIKIRKVPARIGVATDWRRVEATGENSAGLRNTEGENLSGSLYTWGYLGHGHSTTLVCSPTLLSNDVHDFACSFSGGLYLLDLAAIGSGIALYTYGSNKFGMTGTDIINFSIIQPSQISTIEVVQSGFNDNNRRHLCGGDTYNYVIGLNNSKIFAAGRNNLNHVFLQDGHKSGSTSPYLIDYNQFSFISASGNVNDSCFGIRNGELYAWGQNPNGAYGNGSTQPVIGTIRIGNDVGWTFAESYNSVSIGIKKGELYSWGGGSARSGRGNLTSVSSPVRIGTESTWTQASTGNEATGGIRSGELYLWGNLGSSGLGGGASAVGVSSPVRLGTESNWDRISAGYNHFYGIRGGELYAWGNNNLGQLGDGTTTTRSSPVRIGTESNWAMINGGYLNAYGIRNGELYAWGRNSFGQLGDGTTTNRSSPVRIGTESNWTYVSSSSNFGFSTIGIRGGELYAWGRNFLGQLGDGTTTTRSSPVRIGTLNNWLLADMSTSHAIAIR